MTTHGTDVNFGVILEINGQDVAIEPAKVVTEAKTSGVEFTLPHRIEVESVGDLTTFVGTLTSDTPKLPQASDFPSPLDQAYAKLQALNLAVEELTLKIPPSHISHIKDGKKEGELVPIPPADQEPTTFTIGLSATWSNNDKVDLITGKLAIKGIYVKVVKT